MPGKCKNTKYTKYRWDEKQQKCVVRKQKGSWEFGIDDKRVEVEGIMKTKKSGKKIFKPKSRSDKKMFRIIDRNKRKGIKR